MENKKLLILVVVLSLIIAMGIGFGIGRIVTIRRASRIFAHFTREQMLRPEIEEYRAVMEPLIQEKQKLVELLCMAIEREDSLFAYRVAGEIAEVQNEMLMHTVQHLLRTGGHLPPEVRRDFIGFMLRGKPKPNRRLR